MSFDLEILPTRATPPDWDEVWAHLAPAHRSAFLVHLRERRPMPPETPLATDSVYGVEGGLGEDEATGAVSSLTILTFPVDDAEIRPGRLGFAKNLPESTRAELVEQWRRAGYGFFLESGAGRHSREPALLADLAAALAYVTKGYVVLDNTWLLSDPSVPPGVYTADEFRRRIGAAPASSRAA